MVPDSISSVIFMPVHPVWKDSGVHSQFCQSFQQVLLFLTFNRCAFHQRIWEKLGRWAYNILDLHRILSGRLFLYIICSLGTYKAYICLQINKSKIRHAVLLFNHEQQGGQWVILALPLSLWTNSKPSVQNGRQDILCLLQHGHSGASHPTAKGGGEMGGSWCCFPYLCALLCQQAEDWFLPSSLLLWNVPNYGGIESVIYTLGGGGVVRQQKSSFQKALQRSASGLGNKWNHQSCYDSVRQLYSLNN